MIPTKKLREIAEQLLVKSQADDVTWKRQETTWDPEADPLGPKAMDFAGVAAVGTALRLRKINEYVLDLPASQVRLRYVTPPTAPDYVLMRVCRKDGIEVGSLRADDGDPDWDLLSALYSEADRYVIGWGNVLSDLSRAVTEDGPIG
jgi:hypothetical protein